MGFTEILLIVLVIFLFFGAKRIPQLFKGIGEGINNFNKERKDGEEAKDKDKL